MECVGVHVSLCVARNQSLVTETEKHETTQELTVQLVLGQGGLAQVPYAVGC